MVTTDFAIRVFAVAAAREKYCVTAVTFDTWCTFPVSDVHFLHSPPKVLLSLWKKPRERKKGKRSLINSVNVIEKRKMRHSINLDLGRRARSKTSSCLGIINWPFFPPLLARSPLDFFEKSFYWLATWKSLTMSLRLLPLKLELLQKTDCVLFIHSSLLELCQSKNCQGENIDVLNSSPLSHIPKVWALLKQLFSF